MAVLEYQVQRGLCSEARVEVGVALHEGRLSDLAGLTAEEGAWLLPGLLRGYRNVVDRYGEFFGLSAEMVSLG